MTITGTPGWIKIHSSHRIYLHSPLGDALLRGGFLFRHLPDLLEGCAGIFYVSCKWLLLLLLLLLLHIVVSYCSTCKVTIQIFP